MSDFERGEETRKRIGKRGKEENWVRGRKDGRKGKKNSFGRPVKLSAGNKAKHLEVVSMRNV